MSTLAEIKQAVKELPAEQQFELGTFIWENLRHIPVTYSETVDDRMRDMDRGDKVSWKEVREKMLLNEVGVGIPVASGGVR